MIARAARLGSGAADRRALRSPTSCSCCGAADASRRCATTPRSCASTRAAARARARRRAPLARARRARAPRQRARGVAARAAAPAPRGAARRRRACAPDAPIVLVAEMEPPRPGRRRRAWRGCAPTSAPASARSIRPRRPTRSRTSARPSVLAGTTPEPLPLALVLRRVGREARGRRCPPPRSPPSSTSIYAVYGVHVPAAALDPLRAAAAALDRSRGARFRAATTHARDHGLPPPRLRGADRRPRDADAEVPAGGGRRSRAAPSRARRGAGAAARARTLLRVHTRALRRRGAHAASRARSPSRRSSRGRRRSGRRCCSRTAARSRRPARALDDGVAAALASGFHHSHADHGEGFCTFNGLVVAAEALRAAGRVRTRRRARPRPALRQRHRVALRRRGRGSSTARSTATTTGRTRRTATSRPCGTRDGANHVSFALPNGSGRAALLDGARARHRGDPRAGAGPTSCSTRPAPIPTARIPTRRSTSTTTTCASATASSSRGRRREGLPLAWVLAGGYTHGRVEGRGACTSAPSTPRRDVHGVATARDEAGREPARSRSGPASSSLFFYLPIAILIALLVQRVAAQHRLERLHARVVRGALARHACWCARSRTA